MSATLEPFGTRKVQQVLAMKQRIQHYISELNEKYIIYSICTYSESEDATGRIIPFKGLLFNLTRIQLHLLRIQLQLSFEQLILLCRHNVSQ